MQPASARRSRSEGGGGRTPAVARSTTLRSLAETSLRALKKKWSYRQMLACLHQDDILRRNLFAALHPLGGYGEGLVIEKEKKKQSLKCVTVPPGSALIEQDITAALQLRFSSKKGKPRLEQKRQAQEEELAAAASLVLQVFQVPLLRAPERALRIIFSLSPLPSSLRALILDSGSSALSKYIPVGFFANLKGLWIPSLALAACDATYTILGPDYIYLCGHGDPAKVAEAVRRLRHCSLKGLLVSMDDVDVDIPSKVEVAVGARQQKLSKVLDFRHPFCRRPVRLFLFVGQSFTHSDTATIFRTGDPFRRAHILANCPRPTSRHHRRPPLPFH